MRNRETPTVRQTVQAYELVFCRYLVLGFAVIGVPTSIFAWYFNAPTIAYGCALFTASSWTTFFLLGKIKKLALVVESYFAITFATIYILSYSTGGVPGPMGYSFYLVPVMAMVCRGKVSSSVWAVMTMLGVLSFLKLLPSGSATSSRILDVFLMLATFLAIHLISLAGRIFTERSFDKLLREEQQKADLQRQLTQASKLASLGTLGAGVAHELNNPLAAVLGFANIIKKRSDPDSEIAMLADRITKASKRMAAIVLHLRQFSRDSTHDPKKAVDFMQVIRDSLILLEGQLRSYDINVEINGSSAFVNGDPNQLESVIQNLLSNSRDAFKTNNIAPPRRITMTVKEQRDAMAFEYVDNAGGMPPEVVARIFDPFFTTKDAGVGIGLGMSISYEIIQKHGGVIKVSSEQGCGTVFHIELPLHTQSSDIATSKEEPAHAAPVTFPSSQSDEKPSLLLVDDEPDLITILSSVLGESFTIDAFTDGRTAAEALTTNKHYDFVLTDLKMPHVSGLQIITAARQKHPKATVFVMSGHAAESDEAQSALDAGAAGVIRKPLPEAPELVALLLSGKKARA